MPQVNIVIDINETIYIRDPLATKLGRNIIKYSIELLDELGFEEFNFKKLAERMTSTEASVYRYFENKYKLLAYLVAWYWDYMHFMILMDIRSIDDPQSKLHCIIETLVTSINNRTTPEYIDLGKLHHLVVENATKVYHNKKVDLLKEEGFYTNLQKLVKTISGVILEMEKAFEYPRALANTIVDMCLNTEYNLEHLNHLTDVTDISSCDPQKETIDMIKYIVDRVL